jgi:hypothetical protein
VTAIIKRSRGDAAVSDEALAHAVLDVIIAGAFQAENAPPEGEAQQGEPA